MNYDEFFAANPEWRPFADLVVYPPTPDEVVEEFPEARGSDLFPDRYAACFGGKVVSRCALYVKLRRENQEHRWAEMMACQSFPGIETTDTFWGGRKHFAEIYGEEYANRIKKLLAKQGVNLLPGQEYMPELARHQGDPEAVVPFGGGRSYIKSLCEKRGWQCDGAVTTAHRQPEEDPHETGIPLAEDLIRKKAGEMVQQNPELRRKSRGELREMVLAKHGPSKNSLKV